MSAHNTYDSKINNLPPARLDDWEMDVLQRFPDPDAIVQGKIKEEFRRKYPLLFHCK